MLITVDTNILISATFWKGNESKIIDLAENRKISLVLSKAVLLEFEDVLKRKFGHIVTEKERGQLLEKIVSISQIVEPTIKVNLVKEDPDDNKIIACAIAGNANYIVSGDKHLLNLEIIKTIKIVTAKTFLETTKYSKKE